jgi:hypothetical protein
MGNMAAVWKTGDAPIGDKPFACRVARADLSAVVEHPARAIRYFSKQVITVNLRDLHRITK